MGFSTRDSSALERQRFRDRKSRALNTLSDEALALIGTSVPGKAKGKPKAKRATVGRREAEAFYASWDWRKLRMKTLIRYGHVCQCCGARPGQLTVGGEVVRLVVDHIKPLARNWELRLEPRNLQVLCDECNMGKGRWDETDYR